MRACPGMRRLVRADRGWATENRRRVSGPRQAVMLTARARLRWAAGSAALFSGASGATTPKDSQAARKQHQAGDCSGRINVWGSVYRQRGSPPGEQRRRSPPRGRRRRQWRWQPGVRRGGHSDSRGECCCNLEHSGPLARILKYLRFGCKVILIGSSRVAYWVLRSSQNRRGARFCRLVHESFITRVPSDSRRARRPWTGSNHEHLVNATPTTTAAGQILPCPAREQRP